MLGLNIKQAELLDSGEIKLGSGKIIGHRQWKYIYKQRYRGSDKREAVLAAKLSLEYRKIRAIANGEVFDGSVQIIDPLRARG